MTRLTLALLAGLTLAGCSQAQTATTIAASGNALVAADELALAYVTLPLCPAGKTMAANGTLCSQAAISAQIKLRAQQAHDAYKAAEANSTSATQAAAAAALVALQAVIPPATN